MIALRRACAGTLCALTLALAACHKKKSSDDDNSGAGGGGSVSSPGAPAPSQYDLVVRVVSEAGSPVPGATVTSGTRSRVTDDDGLATFEDNREPVLLVVAGPGILAQPFLADLSDAQDVLDLETLALVSPAGATRVSLHFGGDVMLGRRYLAPALPHTAVLSTGDGGTSARGIVASLAPLTSAADITVVNLETVIGGFPESAAYPRKRFLLQSPPEILEAMEAMGVDVANVGNNHLRDWLDPGIASTLSSLDAAGFPRCGGGATEAEAASPAVLVAGGSTFAFLSYCSINGDIVNDAYPLDTDPIPPDVDPDELWQYEFRTWSFTGPTVAVPGAARRLGSAWAALLAAEGATSDPAEIAALWASATAVYPELQDWVARRGHGGANALRPSRFTPDVLAARAAGADVVVVSLHGSFQYAETRSTGIEAAAYAAIDAGADLVVCHHTHVLQGMEFYKGKLVCWSLGNCVFDQDFLATFRSGILRVVLEGSAVVQTTFYPATILGYRPAPVTGGAARDVLGIFHERSHLPFAASRVDGAVRNVQRTPDPSAVRPRLRLRGHVGRLEEAAGEDEAVEIESDDDGLVDLAGPALTRSRSPGGSALPAGLRFGRDLYGFGDFEDWAADGNHRGGLHWNHIEESADKRVTTDASAFSGEWLLRLYRKSSNSTRVRMRPVARLTFQENRFWSDPAAGPVVPVDGTPDYSVLLRAASDGDVSGSVIFDVYHFDDTNPTEDPESVLLRTFEVSFSLDEDGDWRRVVLDVPPEAFAPSGGLSSNMAMAYVALYPPPEGDTTLLVDDLRFIQWRSAASLPDGFYLVDAVRFPSGGGTALLERRGN